MQPKETLNITGDACPMTFVKTKLALELLTSGEVMEVTLNGGEAIKNVPRSVRNEGHKVLSLQKQDDGTYRMLVEKDGGHE